MSLRSLQLYTPPARKAEFDARIRKAGSWLQEAKPIFNDEYAMLLLGLKWTGADKAKVTRYTSVLLNQQRKDGGWEPTLTCPQTLMPPGRRCTRCMKAAG